MSAAIPIPPIPARRGFIRVSLDILPAALGLPEGMYVVGVAREVDDVLSNTFSLAVAGDPCPEVPAGTKAPHLWMLCERDGAGRIACKIAGVGPSEPLPPAMAIADRAERLSANLLDQLQEAVDSNCAGGDAFDGDPSRILGQGAV